MSPEAGLAWVVATAVTRSARGHDPAQTCVFGTPQVVYDVAYAIGEASALRVVHRDVTPNNFGAKDGRGYLLDFSAAKVRRALLWHGGTPLHLPSPEPHQTALVQQPCACCYPPPSPPPPLHFPQPDVIQAPAKARHMHDKCGGHKHACVGPRGAQVQEQDAGERPSPAGLHHITGTLRWAPYSAMDGQRHSVSSDLEGLFISVAYIAMDGRGWPGRSDGVGDLDSWRRRRLAQFGCRTIQSEDRVAPHLRPLVQALHGLFWPLAEGASVRSYRTDVSVVEVQNVCMSVAQEHCTAQLQPPHA